MAERDARYCTCENTVLRYPRFIAQGDIDFQAGAGEIIREGCIDLGIHNSGRVGNEAVDRLPDPQAPVGYGG